MTMSKGMEQASFGSISQMYALIYESYEELGDPPWTISKPAPTVYLYNAPIVKVV